MKSYLVLFLHKFDNLVKTLVAPEIKVITKSFRVVHSSNICTQILCLNLLSLFCMTYLPDGIATCISKLV